MFKRSAAIIFILLANLILLVHGMVPHHHHETQVCLINSHCSDDEEVQLHKDHQPLHEHDGEGDRQHCILKQDLAAPSASFKLSLIPQADVKGRVHPYAHDQAVLINASVPVPCRIVLSGRMPGAHHAPGYALLLCRINGLRAPPLS